MSDQQETLGRLDQLLMRVLDGEATVQERQELLALPDSEVQLAALRGLSEVLVEAVRTAAGQEPELAEPVLCALGRDDGWSTIAGAMRQSVAGSIDVADQVMASLGLTDEVSEALSELRGLASSPVDLVDGVMASILEEASPEASAETVDKLEVASPEAWVSALHDGELSVEERLRIANELPGDQRALAELTAYAEIGRMVRQALREETRQVSLEQVWPKVAGSIGLESPDHVPGWEPVAAALRTAVATRSELTLGEQRELADHVMAALPQETMEPVELNLAPDPSNAALPWWRGVVGPGLALVAVALFMVSWVQTGGEAPGTPGIDSMEEVFELASANDAELEDFEMADGVMLHVLQAEEGGPMILMLEEVSDSHREDDGWEDIDWEEI